MRCFSDAYVGAGKCASDFCLERSYQAASVDDTELDGPVESCFILHVYNVRSGIMCKIVSIGTCIDCFSKQCACMFVQELYELESWEVGKRISINYLNQPFPWVI